MLFDPVWFDNCEALIRDFMKVYHPFFLAAVGSTIAFTPLVCQAAPKDVSSAMASPQSVGSENPSTVTMILPIKRQGLIAKALPIKPIPQKALLKTPVLLNTPAVAQTPKLLIDSTIKPSMPGQITPSKFEAQPSMVKPVFESPRSLSNPVPTAKTDAKPPEVKPPEVKPPEVKPEIKLPAAKPPETPFPPTKSAIPMAPSGGTTPPPPNTSIIPPKPAPLPDGPPPGYLNPKAKALLFPTRPEEVKLVGVQPISLRQALDLAERNNRDLAVSRLEIERGRAVVQENQASLYPTFDLQGSFSRGQSAGSEISVKASRNRAIRENGGQRSVAERFSPNVFRADGNATSTTFDALAQISYDIFTSGRRSGQIQAAKQQLRGLELQYERTLEQLLLDVTDDYYSLQDADEQVAINEAAVKSGQSNLKDAEAQERAGLGTRFDVLRAQVQLANNNQQLTNAKGNRDIRRRQIVQRLSLSEVVGVVTADEVKKADIYQPLATSNGQLSPLENLIVLAYKNRVELEEQLVQRDLSETQRRIALAALGPTVSVRGQYDLQKQLEQPVTGLADGYSLSVTAQWRLFDGGRARATAQQQALNGKIAEERFAQARNQVRFQVEQAYTNLLSNNASIGTTEQAVIQAEEALRLAVLRFQAGVGTQTDRINAESDLTRARGNRISAIIGYNRSLAQLRRAVSNVTELPKYNKISAN